MQPKTVVDDGSEDLFRSRLEAMIDLRHELVKLGKATRLVGVRRRVWAGLHEVPLRPSIWNG